MARTRDDDYEDDEPEDRPPPRRRPRDEDDDAALPSGGELGPLDKLFRDTNIVILIIFGCCCSGIAFILALVCYITAKDPKAKSNAMIVMGIGAALTALGIIASIVQLIFLGGK
jgi:hypothetical protein